MARTTLCLLAIASQLIGSACSRPTPEAQKRAIAADRGSTANMWYRVSVATRYGGRPVTFDQLVICYMRRVPGAALGTMPAYNSRKMHPMSVGRVMPDGSFVAVRLPDLCKYNRRFTPGEFGVVKVPGWGLRGPFGFFPLMVWSDRPVRPSVTEAYVGDSYYADPRARLARPHAQVEFLPATFRPPNARAILDQRNAIADNSAGADMGMSAEHALPMSDPSAGPAFSTDFVRESGASARFAVFTGPRRQLQAPDDAGPASHHRWRDVRDCLDFFQAGAPNSAHFAADSESGHTLDHPQNRPIVERRTLRRRSCYALLNGVMPFTWTGSAFVANTKERGVLRYQRASAAWRNAPYLIDGEQVPEHASLRDGRSGEWFQLTSSASPTRDPDGGE